MRQLRADFAGALHHVYNGGLDAATSSSMTVVFKNTCSTPMGIAASGFDRSTGSDASGFVDVERKSAARGTGACLGTGDYVSSEDTSSVSTCVD